MGVPKPRGDSRPPLHQGKHAGVRQNSLIALGAAPVYACSSPWSAQAMPACMGMALKLTGPALYTFKHYAGSHYPQEDR